MSFGDAAVDPGAGELEDVLYEPDERALVLLVESENGATLAVVPTGPGGSAPHRQLPAHARRSNAALHALARDRVSGRILVATAAGIFAFAPAGTSAAPALAPVEAFAAPELHAPVLVP